MAKVVGGYGDSSNRAGQENSQIFFRIVILPYPE